MKVRPKRGVHQIWGELAQCILATLLISLGVTVFIKCELGSDTLTVFLDGMNRSFGLPVSLVDQVFTGTIFVLAWILNREQIGMNSVVNTLSLGICLEISEILLPTGYLSECSVEMRFVGVLAAQCMIAIGYAWLLTLSSGVDVIDAFLYGIVKRTHVSYVILHMIFDALCITVGFWLHGIVGIGTIISMLTMGILISEFRRLIEKMKQRNKFYVKKENILKRLLSSTATELLSMNKKEKLLAIQSSEGRTMLVEMTTEGAPDALENSSMGELYAAFGADILLLNRFDVFKPSIQRIDVENCKDCVKTLRKYTGKFVGINLEPVAEKDGMQVEQVVISKGRLATREAALEARELGVDIITLTGNPDTGVTNEGIIRATRVMKEAVGDDIILIAGKMHAAGSLQEAGPNLISKDVIRRLAEAGADIILLPAPGTVPGITLDYVWDLVNYCHSLGVMTLTTIGTSQEEAEKETIQQLALMCKMAGTDIHHIGDAGHAGCVAESIMTYSIAIRGKRHTYNRLASSVYR